MLTLTFGAVDAGDRRLLAKLVSGAEDVTGFRLSEDGMLVVLLRSAEGEAGLVRTLAAAGIYPRSTHEPGAKDERGPYAC
jgi:hypothetical protein